MELTRPPSWSRQLAFVDVLKLVAGFPGSYGRVVPIADACACVDAVQELCVNKLCSRGMCQSKSSSRGEMPYASIISGSVLRMSVSLEMRATIAYLRRNLQPFVPCRNRLPVPCDGL